ncbi:MAG: EAL domain-containing protein [Firmicutes bacterium]|nr:EAL domain-containing protein [Bacillota bacterium]
MEVELTESSLMLADAELLSLQLVEYGVRLAIDDFGTGYASLSYLRRFPVHRVKIDRSFVAFVPEDPYNVQLVSAIIAMAKRLDLQVTAEGVETKAQADFLREQGCDLLQGYLFGRPEEPSSCLVRPS